MAERSIAYIVGFLTLAGTLLALPNIGMYYGLHHWTAAHHPRRGRRALHRAGRHRAGVAARTDRHDSDAGLDRQFGAGPAEGHVLRRDGLVHQSGAVAVAARDEVSERDIRSHPAVTDASNGTILVPANYGELGHLYVVVIAIGFSLPMLTIIFVKATRFRSA